ncbi:hypothetical protein QUB37_03730 [Microcoleus sp. AT3-A2]|uniref:hypothetical protein n=1 Tax=Microcoleus sp. AT3-A2 TaxID=2818610 RepID=UPI002FCED8DE
MKLNEVLTDILSLAEEEDKLEPNDTLEKQWIKSIEQIDKSVSTGFSLVGNFVSESEELEPGLYLVYQQLVRPFVVEKTIAKWEGERWHRNIVTDENGNIVFEKKKVEETKTVRRGILFDFSDRITLVYCRFLPERWAKRLWKPIEDWLEQQPFIEAKIEFWEKEVALRTDSLRQAQQRLAALKQQIATGNEDLDPQTKEWLQTAAVLGNKKGGSTAETNLTKTFY